MSYAKNITYAICEELLLRHFFATSFFKVLWGIFGPRRQWLSHYLSKSHQEIEHWVNFLVPLQQKKVGDLMFFCNHVFGIYTSKKQFMPTLKNITFEKKYIFVLGLQQMCPHCQNCPFFHFLAPECSLSNYVTLLKMLQIK